MKNAFRTWRKTLAALLLTALVVPTAFLGCGDTEGDEAGQSGNVTSGETSGAEDAVSSGAADEVSNVLTVKFSAADGENDWELSGEGTVSRAVGGRYEAGDTVTVELPEGQKYLAITLCAKIGEAIVYVPGGVYTYQIPSDAKSYMNPAIFNVPNTITARIPTDEELQTERNLALNPYDIKTAAATAFPHATTNNQYNAAEFGVHNILDGESKNSSHGTYPYQSWGAKETVKASDEVVINFGREVTVNSLVLYLRADFASNHDAYFTSVTVEFSDGSSVVVNPTRTATAQTFDLGGVTTTSIRFTGFETDTSRGVWAGFTEVQVLGAEALSQ